MLIKEALACGEVQKCETERSQTKPQCLRSKHLHLFVCGCHSWPFIRQALVYLGVTFGQFWINLCCGKCTVAMNLFQTWEGKSGIVIACMLCLTRHIRAHVNLKLKPNAWQMMNKTSTSDFINKWWSCLIPGRNRMTWLPSVFGKWLLSWNAAAEWRSGSREDLVLRLSREVCMCVRHRWSKVNADRSVCLHVYACLCLEVYVWDGDRGSRQHLLRLQRSQMWEKCTFSFSQGGGWAVRQSQGSEMQVVLLDVLVSSKPDKSNQVLSGSATISWLFEPSGPCSSDLCWGILSGHLEAMWEKRILWRL